MCSTAGGRGAARSLRTAVRGHRPQSHQSCKTSWLACPPQRTTGTSPWAAGPAVAPTVRGGGWAGGSRDGTISSL